MLFGQDAGVAPTRAGLPPARARLKFSRASSSSLWRSCKLTAPLLQRRAHAFALALLAPHRHHAAAEADGARDGARGAEERHVRVLTLVRRGKSVRRITSPAAVEAELRRFATAWALTVRVVYLEQLSAVQQLDLATRTALLVGYHGSGVGALHVWMPRGRRWSRARRRAGRTASSPRAHTPRASPTSSRPSTATRWPRCGSPEASTESRRRLAPPRAAPPTSLPRSTWRRGCGAARASCRTRAAAGWCRCGSRRPRRRAGHAAAGTAPVPRAVRHDANTRSGEAAGNSSVRAMRSAAARQMHRHVGSGTSHKVPWFGP